MLLADIKGVFAERNTDRLPSASLVAMLVEIEGRPWAEYRHGKPMTQNQLARALKPLGIAPEVIRQGEGTARGYTLGQFSEAFERYLSSEGVSNRNTVTNAVNTGTSELFQTVTREDDVTVQKCEKSSNDGLCYGVTVQKGEEGVCAHCGAPERPGDGGNEPGLNWRTIDRLASEVEEWAYANRDKVRTDQASVIEAEIRRRVIGAGVLPETVAVETERVMTSLFEGREAAGGGDGRA